MIKWVQWHIKKEVPYEEKNQKTYSTEKHKRKSQRLPSLGAHFLYQRKHWQQGYARALRNHWYCGAYIPQMTLHRAIHSKLHDIPVPNGKECRKAFEELMRRDQQGLLSTTDSPMTRLSFLIEMFRDSCPATTAMLEWQYEIVKKFYDGCDYVP